MSFFYLLLQIPEFGGAEKDNVKMWVQRVDNVTSLHKISDSMMHLAASSRLVDAAKKWYDLQSGVVLESWLALRRELVTMFEQRVPFYVAMREVETRVWLSHKEPFRQYALDKLALMHPLNLHIADQINLLIGGITSQTIRAIALSLKVEAVEQFLEIMHPITEDVAELEKRAPAINRSAPTCDLSCRNCSKRDHTHRDCRNPDITCFYCKAKGHKSYQCPRLSRGGERTTAAGGPRAAGGSSAAGSMIAAIQQENEDKLIVNNVCVSVENFNGVKCKLRAMIDTGSPISFVCFDVYRRFSGGEAVRKSERQLFGDQRFAGTNFR